jgi:hypothetical protein
MLQVMLAVAQQLDLVVAAIAIPMKINVVVLFALVLLVDRLQEVQYIPAIQAIGIVIIIS